jgi:hypothetical protein
LGEDVIMNRVLYTVLAAVILCPHAASANGKRSLPAPAQETKSAEQLPSVDQILNRYVQALGGKAAIERLTSMAMTGTIEVQSAGLKGKTEMIANVPNKYLLKIEIDGIGAFTQGFDGTTGWAQDPMNGLRDISGLELAQLKREADLHREVHLKDVYTKLLVKGKEKVGASDTYVVEGTLPEGGTEKLYFDAQGGLLLRTDSVSRSPQGEIPVEAYIEEYKEVNGVKMPVALRQVTSVLTSSIKFTDIKFNVEVDQSRFNKPKGQ